MNGVVKAINKVIQVGTVGGAKAFEAPTFFTETLLLVFFVVGLTYVMKTLEFLIFRSKL
jgi:hypothetical protein